MLIDSWAMPAQYPGEVHSALARLRRAREQMYAGHRRDVNSDGSPSVDRDRDTNRFRDLVVPDAVTPWAYNPSEWMDKPPLDEDIQAVLVEHLATEGAASHDLSGGVDDEDEFFFVDADDVTYPESADGSIGDVAERFRNLDSTLQDPSTTGASTSSSSAAGGSGSRRGGSFASEGGMPND